MLVVRAESKFGLILKNDLIDNKDNKSSEIGNNTFKIYVKCHIF